MRIAFLGKGGSGKTTLAAAFTRYESAKRDHILAIDADMNVHLQDALSMDGECPKMGEKPEEISNYLKGGRDMDTTMIHTTPPSKDSNFVRINKEDNFLQEYALQTDKISLLTVGSYEKSDMAKTCYHGKLEGLEMVFHRLLDSENDLVVADATAGVDNFGSSLLFAYDLNVFVVEPTKKSAAVYKDYKEKTDEQDVNIKVIANKVETEEDKKFIKEHVDESDLLCMIERSRDIRRFEQGNEEAMKDFVEENEEKLEKIEHELFSIEKNWDMYLEKLREIHVESAEAWYEDYYQEPVSEQAKQEFSYQKVI